MAMKIHLSDSACAALRDIGGYRIKLRGETEIKVSASCAVVRGRARSRFIETRLMRVQAESAQPNIHVSRACRAKAQ